MLGNLPKVADKGVTRGMDPLFDMDENIKRLIALFAPVYTDHVKEAGAQAMLLVGAAGFDYEDPHVTNFILPGSGLPTHRDRSQGRYGRGSTNQ